MDIELYSVKGFTGSALRKKLEEKMQRYHMPYMITEINHVDQFIKAGLASVPAFKIGERVIQHPHDGDPDKTVDLVMEYLLGENINTILVPVDFTEESTHAIGYATMIARNLNMGITVAHVHQTLYDPVSAGALDVQFLQDSNTRLQTLVDKLNLEHEASGINVPVLAHLEVGEASSSLIGMLDNGHYDMMIMGTKASDTTIRRLFGTISADVCLHSNKPVLVVPPQTEHKFPGKMVVGFTEELMLNGNLEYILNFGAKNNVFFDFVQITNDHEEFHTLKQKLYEKLVINRELICGFNIRSLNEDEHKIHELLFEYAREVRAGMIVLVCHHRSFLENISHSSVTKKALQQPPVPLLILHHKK